jgi:predicted nucleic acid-binding protein
MSRAVVLDTNILVSAALKPGSEIARILERVLLRQAPVYVCPSIVTEYREVLHRPTLRPKGLPPAWLPRLLQIAFHEPEPAPWLLEGPDPDDLVFLALAKAVGAVLVTGNQADFPRKIRDGVEVMSPLEYLGQTPHDDELALDSAGEGDAVGQEKKRSWPIRGPGQGGQRRLPAPFGRSEPERGLPNQPSVLNRWPGLR